MRFGGGELYRSEVRANTTNVAEVNIEKVGGVIKSPLGVVAKKSVVRPGDISGPLPRWGLRCGFKFSNFNGFFL